MLDQIAPTRAFPEDRVLQLAHSVELMEARKGKARDLLLLVLPRDHVAAEDIEPAITLPHLFPEIARAVSQRVRRVAFGAIVAFIEGQENRRRPFQPRRHVDFGIADREMHQRAAREAQERLRRLSLGSRVPVEAILVHRVLHALREVGLEFDCGDGQAVEEEDEVEAVLIRHRVAHLPHDAQPVRLVARHEMRRSSPCAGLNWASERRCFRPIISMPLRSTSSVPRSSSCLRTGRAARSQQLLRGSWSASPTRPYGWP